MRPERMSRIVFLFGRAIGFRMAIQPHQLGRGQDLLDGHAAFRRFVLLMHAARGHLQILWIGLLERRVRRFGGGLQHGFNGILGAFHDGWNCPLI